MQRLLLVLILLMPSSLCALGLTGGGGGAGPGTGNVIVSGAPTAGQIGEWTDATHIQGRTILPVTAGATGVGTLLSKGVVVGQGTAPVSGVAPTGNSQCLMSASSNGTTTDPSFQTCPGQLGNVALDLGDNAVNESTALTEIATVGDTNAIFSEPAADKLLITVSNKWPAAGTADTLTGTLTLCPVGEAARGITAAGAGAGCFDAATQAELDAHSAGTTVHSATSANTPSRLVLRDASGNFTAGTITANVTGNVSGNAGTATNFDHTPLLCPAGQVAAGIDAHGDRVGCVNVATGTGNPIVLDFADDGSNESAGIVEIAVVGDTHSIFTEPANDKLLINVGNKWPTATKADALTTAGTPCTAGNAALGVDAGGNATGCFDVATQTELDAHTGSFTAHGATAANTASRIVLRDGAGNFSAGMITANLTGNVTGNASTAGNATTATQLQNNGGNCVGAADFPKGVDAAGVAEACTAVVTSIGGANPQQITTSGSTGNITISTPQDIGTASAVQFGRLGLGVAAPGTAGQLSQTAGANAITLHTLKRAAVATSGNFADYQDNAGASLWTVDITGKLINGSVAGSLITGNIAGNAAGLTTTLGTGGGGTGVTTAPDDQILVGNGTLWQQKALPLCLDTGGQHLNYDTATNAFTCGTSGGATGTGDITTVANCTTGDCATATGTALQYVWMEPMATPSNPVSGKEILYVGTTTGLSTITNAGIVRHGVRTKAVSTDQFLTGIGDDGAVSSAVVDFGNLSGQASNTQIPGTLTNKRLHPRTVAITGTGPFSAIDSDNTDTVYHLGLTAAATFNAPLGNPVDGQLLAFRLVSAAPQTLTFSILSNAYSDNADIPFPATTLGGGKETHLIFKWNGGAVAKWVLIGSNVAATTLPVKDRTRTCMMVIGDDDPASPVLTNPKLGPQLHLCRASVAMTVTEIAVYADAGTPNVIVHKRLGTTNTALLSSALATAAAGAIACSKSTAVVGLDTVTTCAATLQNPAIPAGYTIGLTSGTAGGVARRMTIAVTMTVD
jgi:hypothetical protein